MTAIRPPGVLLCQAAPARVLRPIDCTRGAAVYAMASALLVLALGAVPLAAAVSIHVAHANSSCSDTAAGTEAAPLCTIAAAVKKARGGADKDVVLRAGTFVLTAPVRLAAADSGLTLRAADGERVGVSGGIAVTGWVQDPATNGMWSAPVPASCGCAKGGVCGPSSCMAHSSPRQLYVNGRRANRTSANASVVLGWMGLSTTGASSPPQSPTGIVGGSSGGAYSVEKPALKGWGPTGLASTDMEFVYPAQHVPWTEPRCGIKAVSADGGTIHMQECLSQLPPAPGCAGPAVNHTLCPRRWFMSGLPGLLENAFELLYPKDSLSSTAGQFYIDRSKATVFYVPHPGEDLKTAHVVLPLLEAVLQSDGATDLTITGIDFTHTAWGGPDQPCGYVPTQAGWGNRPVDEPHALGPMPPAAAATTTATTTKLPPAAALANTAAPGFVIGAGGALPYLDSSQPGQARMVSHSGTAELTIQDDANICGMVFSNRSCTKSGCLSTRWCIGAPVCPCAPLCKGPDKKPPFCNASAASGYRLTVGGGGEGRAASPANLCVHDTATNTDRWCALASASASASTTTPTGPHHMMLADDGSICIHAGTFSSTSTHATIWCHVPPGASPSGTALSQIPAGVQLSHTTNSLISKCSFAHMGGAGLDVYGASQHTRVAGCYAHDISGTAIQFGGTVPCPACPTTEPCGVSKGTSGTTCPTALPSPKIDLNLSFVDNVVADVTREFHGCLGVWGGYARQTLFTHNDICRTAYGGLSLGWGWAIPWQNTFQRENEVSHNHITHWMGVLDDSGATYTLGPHMNSSLHHNYAAHAGEVGMGVAGGPTGPSGSGIEPGGSPHGGAYYPDDGSAFWDIHDNVAEDLNGGHWLFAWNANDQHDLTVNNNFVDTETYVCASKTCTVDRTHFVNRSSTPPQPWPPAAMAIMRAAGARAAGIHPDALAACKHPPGGAQPAGLPSGRGPLRTDDSALL